jgi:RNA polymerase sigma-70 factor (ECF subfamily)
VNASEQQLRFNEWIREHGPILHHVVNGFAAGSDRDDLFQEVLLAVWKSVPFFRGQAKASTYLYRVSHNAALWWTRGEKNYRRRLQEFRAALPSESTAEEEASTDKRLEELYAAIRSLKPVDRSLTLMSLDGLTYRQMAEVLGLSETHVGVKLNRIKTQLARTLKGNHHESE